MNDLSLLPGDPVRFFGLSEGFDRRDLKRAYGKAIRVYKPETHAAEFGRVRDAYERLERMLRYGKQQQQQAETTAEWNRESKPPLSETVSASTSSTSSTSSASDSLASSADAAVNSKPIPKQPERGKPLSLRALAVMDPVGAARRFESMSRRTPPDYYVAAILADATQGRPTAKYFGVLLDGIAAHPTDPGLMNLAMEYVRTEVPDEMAAKVVRYVAEKLRRPSFYMLTEPLWLRLVAQFPFEQWESLLRRCERELRQTEPIHRTVFYLRLLRSAIWKSPQDWVDRVISEIETESAGLPYLASSELDFLSQVQQLLRCQTMAGSIHPMRQTLLEAIRLSCQRDDPEATADVLKRLAEIARNAKGIREAFPMSSAAQDSPWVMLTYSIVEQYEVMLGSTEEIDHSRLLVQIKYLAQDLMVPFEKINSAINSADWNYRMWPLVAWVIVGTIVGAVPVSVLPIIVFGGSGNVGALVAVFGIVVLSVALFFIYFRYLYPRFLHERLLKKRQTNSSQAYERHWRARLFRFVSSTNAPLQELLSRLEIHGRAAGHAALGNTVVHFVRQDAGLCIFATLRMLLR